MLHYDILVLLKDEEVLKDIYGKYYSKDTKTFLEVYISSLRLSWYS